MRKPVAAKYSEYILSLGNQFELCKQKMRSEAAQSPSLAVDSLCSGLSQACKPNLLLASILGTSVLSPMGSLAASELISSSIVNLIQPLNARGEEQKEEFKESVVRGMKNSEKAEKKELNGEKINNKEKQVLVQDTPIPLKLPSLEECNKTAMDQIGSTASKPVPKVEQKEKEDLDDKLNNIIESTKRVFKKAKKDIKFTRNRKTSSQIAVLEKELVGSGEISKERVSQIAAETGLRKSQVYKWFWDNRKKAKGQ